MKSPILRVIWIVPNILLYILAIAYGIVVSKIYAPPENILVPVIALTALVLINIFGTIRIVSWIKDGEI